LGTLNEPDGKYWGGTVEDIVNFMIIQLAVKRALLQPMLVDLMLQVREMLMPQKFLKAFLLHCDSGTNYVTGR